MNEMDTINVLLIDDHQIVLDGLKSLLNGVNHINIVADACNGKEALLMLSDMQPDLIIADVSMPEMDGIELTEIVKKIYPEIKVLILTVHNEKEILKRALFSGAEACLQKNTSKKELLFAINRIMDKGYYYCDSIMSITRELCNKPEQAKSNLVSLTNRELEILELLLKGYSNKEVADTLSISHHTVSTHRKNRMKKTKSRNISGLFNYAKKNNIFFSVSEEI